LELTGLKKTQTDGQTDRWTGKKVSCGLWDSRTWNFEDSGPLFRRSAIPKVYYSQ